MQKIAICQLLDEFLKCKHTLLGKVYSFLVLFNFCFMKGDMFYSLLVLFRMNDQFRSSNGCKIAQFVFLSTKGREFCSDDIRIINLITPQHKRRFSLLKLHTFELKKFLLQIQPYFSILLFNYSVICNLNNRNFQQQLYD